MQKTAYCGWKAHASPFCKEERGRVRLPAQIVRIMRMTGFLLLAFCIHLSAKTHSQTITLSVKKAPLIQVFEAIKKQAGYYVFYKADLLTGTKPVSVSVYDMPLQDFLVLAFRDQGLTYEIMDKTIMLSRKAVETPPADGVPELIKPVLPPAEVKGQIMADGKPLASASVTLNPGHHGAATNDKGYFTFGNIPPGEYILEVSSIGYKKISKKVIVSGSSIVLDITMQQAVAEVGEIVVTNGYSAKKAGEVTGSVQTISGDDLRKGITTSDPVALLKGRATGLYISSQSEGDPNSSGGQIFVRGQSSIAGVGVDQANQFIMPTLNYGPLLVLDGSIMPNQNLKEIVTPQEIESVTILKDAAATAIYGSRAAGGVIVVTTIRGKSSKPRLTAEVKYGLNHPVHGHIHFMTGSELYAFQKEYFTDDYQVNNASLSGSYPTLQSYLDYRLPTADAVANSFDWQKYSFSNSNTKEVNVGASGGNERTKYYMGAGYYNEQSTAIDNALVRKSFRLNLESRLTDRLTATISLNGILDDGHRELFSTAQVLYQYIPWANPYNSQGKLVNELSYKQWGSQYTNANPFYDNQWNFDKPTSQRMFGSARLAYRITDWLSFTSSNSGNLNYGKDVLYADIRSFAGGSPDNFGNPQGFLGTTTNNLTTYLTSNQLNFHKTSGDHSITALAAMEYGKTTLINQVVNVNHVQAGYPEISMATQIGYFYDYSAYGVPSTKAGNIEGGESDQAVYSTFGEAEYTYKNRYSISGSVRTDASSAFGANKRYGTFGSGGVAWVVSSENFMTNLKWVSNLKLRANYGSTGSQLGDNFLTQSLYRPGYVYGGQTGVTLANIGNPDLRWEVTKTLSGGIDLGLWKRVNATIDAYSRRSDNLLQQVPLTALAGFANQFQNVASVRNKGIELLVNADIIRHKNFSWSASFNISFNRNEILSVANDSLKQGFYSNQSFYLHKGEDINTLKAVRYAGVDAQTGKAQFEKLVFDGDGHRTGVQLVNTIAETNQALDTRQMQTIGSFQPKYFGGLTNTFTYKQLSLDVLITFTMKYFIYDQLAEQMQAGTFASYYNQISFNKGQRLWTHPGQTDANEPWLYYHVKTSFAGSDKYIHDASNARLRSARLSYTLPEKLMKRTGLPNSIFYVSGDNLFTLFSRKIFSTDPEGPSVGQAQTYGQSLGSQVGAPRRIVFGLQVNL